MLKGMLACTGVRMPAVSWSLPFSRDWEESGLRVVVGGDGVLPSTSGWSPLFYLWSVPWHLRVTSCSSGGISLHAAPCCPAPALGMPGAGVPLLPAPFLECEGLLGSPWVETTDRFPAWRPPCSQLGD